MFKKFINILQITFVLVKILFLHLYTYLSIRILLSFTSNCRSTNFANYFGVFLTTTMQTTTMATANLLELCTILNAAFTQGLCFTLPFLVIFALQYQLMSMGMMASYLNLIYVFHDISLSIQKCLTIKRWEMKLQINRWG